MWDDIPHATVSLFSKHTPSSPRSVVRYAALPTPAHTEIFNLATLLGQALCECSRATTMESHGVCTLILTLNDQRQDTPVEHIVRPVQIRTSSDAAEMQAHCASMQNHLFHGRDLTL